LAHLKAIPTWYRGTRFASTLEADWAAMFDHLGWVWQYEPVAVALKDGQAYRPDFYLPGTNVWCEVKGPHNERLDKTIMLQETLGYDEWAWCADLVVILRPPGPGETAQWHGAADGQDIVLMLCAECGHHCFMDYNGFWACRHHRKYGWQNNKPWANGGELIWPGEAKFVRAPRSPRDNRPEGGVA
jgi:hypothetical protein